MDEKTTFRFGPFQLDSECGQVRKDGVALKLQGQPVRILEILLEKPGQLVSRDELRQRLWPSDTFVEFDHSLNTAVKNLRKELGDDPDAPRYVETLRGRGYRFIGEVIREDRPAWAVPDRQATNTDSVIQVKTRIAEGVVGTSGPERRTSLRVVALAASLVLLVVGMYWITRPVPMPKVVGTHRLTNSRYAKGWFIASDDQSIYISEFRPLHYSILRVPLSGEEASEVTNAVGYLADISPSGSHLITVVPTSGSSDIWVVPLPNGTPRFVINKAAWVKSTGDGRGVFFSRNKDTELYRVNLDGSDLRLLAKVPDITGLHRTSDAGRLRFTVLPRSELWEVDAAGHRRRILEHQSIDGGTWRPDGKYYFFSKWDGNDQNVWGMRDLPWHWRIGAGDSQRLTFGPTNFGPPTSSRDGTQLFVRGTDRRGELSVYDRNAGKFVPYLSGIPACFTDFSRDGQWVAWVSYPDGNLWRSRVDGTEKKQLTVSAVAPTVPRWSPSGRLIAFANPAGGQDPNDYSGRLYVISPDGGAPMLLAAGSSLHDPTWSPDGNYIVYSARATPNSDTEILKLDLRTHESTQVAGSQGLWSPRWSPDGRYVVAFFKNPVEKFMIFDTARNSWEELASGFFSWPCWSRDSRFVYVMENNSVVVRIAISTHKKEVMTVPSDFTSISYLGDRWNLGWLGLTPDDRILSTRNTSVQEIYSLDLKYE